MHRSSVFPARTQHFFFFFFFWRANSTQHVLATWKTVRYRELRPQHMWPSQPLSLFPHPNVTLAKVEWNFKKRSTTGNSPRDVHLSKRCEACKKLTQVLCKKTKNPQKNLTVRPENGERLLQLTKETWSLEEKKKRNNKAVTVPKKEQTTKQFLLVHKCSHKVQGTIFTTYQQDNFTTTDDFKCTRLQALPKRSRKTMRSVPWTVLQPTIFFFVALGNAKPRSTIHLLSQ